MNPGGGSSQYGTGDHPVHGAEPALSLVVCTYTRARAEMLDALLKSVREGTRQPAETIVVVDREPELEASLRARLGPQGIGVLGSPGGGLSAARNVGWEAATSAWIAFVDDDAVVAVDWLERLMEEAGSGEGDIIGGRIDPRWEGGTEPTWYSERLGWIVGCSYRGLPTHRTAVGRVIGCNMLVRRVSLDQLAGFSGGLGRSGRSLIGSEETELCIRAGLVGGSVIYLPTARVWQVVPRSRRRVSYALRRAWGEGRSKARLSRLHGRVLGDEGRYARQLLAEAAARAGRAILRLQPGEATRSAMLVSVLAVTSFAYLLERARLTLPGSRSS